MDTLLSMKVFCQVVHSGSFTRAADQLDISVPMASKHVAHLEKSVNARLLYRNNRRPRRRQHRPGAGPIAREHPRVVCQPRVCGISNKKGAISENLASK